ncbi:hypothetical protein Cri9333_0841 [Crinalium epipsammum PCC 9333]|uniref:Uncharacterized protein n=1 Tax=Crinalium epipsammum PCC 9333 TaxID=1173022 RepID=K9VUG8_9CYAN|nr:hypothetical protein [Crinalium epipsammum]AFZ11758.1 hypothetical protein Cri9333_0841 [Crinalium epipsammum PCC 9333]
MKYVAALLLLLVLSFTVALPADAAFCRNYNDHSICILSIQRSAKYYWEYRIAVSIDGVERPIEIYNCRDRTILSKDGSLAPFEPNSAGALICNFINK